MKTQDIKISTALYTLIVIFAFVLGFGGFMAIRGLYSINQGSKSLFHDRIVPLHNLSVISDNLAILIDDTSYEMSYDRLDWTEGRATIQSAREEIEMNWKQYLTTRIEGEEFELVKEAETLYSDATNAVDELIYITSVNDTASMRQLNEFLEADFYPRTDPFIAIIKKIMNIQLEVAQQTNAESEETYNKTRLGLILFFSVTLAIALVLAIVVVKTFSKSLQITNQVIEKIAQGDLTVEITRDSKDEIGYMMRHLKAMVEKNKEIISAIQENAHRLGEASSQLNETAQMLQEGASEQASASEQISASVEEMSSNISQNTYNARRAETLSVKASEDISHVAQSSSESLHKINEIAEKISIIGDISFQTNILALNAAIEAARAGIHGKGFGVVASEVGKLAKRSKEAAIEIEALSKESLTATVDAGRLMEALVPQVMETMKFVQEIAAANAEQHIGADQINDGIQQLNQTTQQTASVAEVMASNAEELNRQAEILLDMISFYKTATTNPNRRLLT